MFKTQNIPNAAAYSEKIAPTSYPSITPCPIARPASTGSPHVHPGRIVTIAAIARKVIPADNPTVGSPQHA